MRWIRRLLNRARAAAHLRRGRRLFQSGRFETGADELRRCLAIGGPNFAAHLLLGQIYLRTSRFDRARREFALARYLDPGRFAAEGLPEDVLLEFAQRFHPTSQRKQPRTPAGDAARVGRESTLDRERADDFVSAAERERFRVLPPLDAEDLDRIDWNRARDLFDG
jgi:tetratricopeptide (TPR) repeat protein